MTLIDDFQRRLKNRVFTYGNTSSFTDAKSRLTQHFNVSKLFGVAPCLLSKLMLKYILINIKTDSNGFRSGHPKTQLYPQTYLSASEEPYRPNDEMLKKKFHIKTNRPLHPF